MRAKSPEIQTSTNHDSVVEQETCLSAKEKRAVRDLIDNYLLSNIDKCEYDAVEVNMLALLHKKNAGRISTRLFKFKRELNRERSHSTFSANYSKQLEELKRFHRQLAIDYLSLLGAERFVLLNDFVKTNKEADHLLNILSASQTPLLNVNVTEFAHYVDVRHHSLDLDFNRWLATYEDDSQLDTMLHNLHQIHQIVVDRCRKSHELLQSLTGETNPTYFYRYNLDKQIYVRHAVRMFAIKHNHLECLSRLVGHTHKALNVGYRHKFWMPAKAK